MPKPASKPRTVMDEIHFFKRRDWDPKLLRRFTKICLSFPEAVEVEQFGGPWFKAGKKPFCIYGAESKKVGEGYEGFDGACFNLTLADQEALVLDPRFAKSPYLGKHGWVTMRWESEPDWDEIEQLAESAYRKVANQRMTRALAARQAG